MAPRVAANARRRPGARAVKTKDVPADEDEEFWGQAAFGSESEDDSFDEDAHSDKGEDVVDSDFDAPEENSDADEKAAASERSKRRASSSRRNGKYVDPALKKTRVSSGGGGGEARPAKRAKTAPLQDAAVDRSSLRKSTKAASAKAGKEREMREAETVQRRMRMRERERRKEPEKVLTQEEMLAEAEETAVGNQEDLERLLRLEEEQKRLPVKAERAAGPTMSVVSREGKMVVGFSEKDADARKEMFPQCEPVEAAEEGEKAGDGAISAAAASGAAEVKDGGDE